jgi:prepilin-type N-terminal cleavage/methylation domain-containing protein
MCFRASNKRSRGFTLLEVMTATMIVAMLSFTLYWFLTTQLYAIHESQEVVDDRESLGAAVRFLQARLWELPLRGNNQLLGQANQFHGQPSDELTWLCTAGQGVLTSAAPGQYRVTLAVQPVSDTSKELELGLRRERLDANAQRDVEFYARGTAGQKYNWLPLVHPMAALEIRYFDSRLNSWQDRWTDPQKYPNLVRVSLWKREGDAPVEAVLTVPSANVQR